MWGPRVDGASEVEDVRTNFDGCICNIIEARVVLLVLRCSRSFLMLFHNSEISFMLTWHFQ